MSHSRDYSHLHDGGRPSVEAGAKNWDFSNDVWIDNARHHLLGIVTADPPRLRERFFAISGRARGRVIRIAHGDSIFNPDWRPAGRSYIPDYNVDGQAYPCLIRTANDRGLRRSVVAETAYRRLRNRSSS